MKKAPYRPWYSDDRVAWAVYAFGLIAMFGVLWTSVVFEGSGDIRVQLERGRFLGTLLFAAGAFAVSGPVTVAIIQLIIGRAARLTEKKPKVAGFEDL